MNQIFTPGQTVYAVFWRRSEDTKFDSVAFYATERGRDNANIELLTYGQIMMTGMLKIPVPVRGKRQLARRL